MKTKKILIEIYYKDINGLGYIDIYKIDFYIPLTDKQTIVGYKIKEAT